MKRMEWFADKHLGKKEDVSVLDVGSYDVNGCYREIFTTRGCKYLGLDMEEGPNVDFIPECVYQWKELEDDQFDIVISGQALEHIEFFWLTVSEMVRVTKENGLICIIAPNGFEEHRYPVDCWRFFTDGMVALGRFNKLDILNAHTNCAPTLEDKDWYSEDCADTMLIAKKPYSGKPQTVDLKDYNCLPANLEELSGNMKSYKDYRNSINNENENKGWMPEKSADNNRKATKWAKRVISRLKRIKIIQQFWVNE